MFTSETHDGVSGKYPSDVIDCREFPLFFKNEIDLTIKIMYFEHFAPRFEQV